MFVNSLNHEILVNLSVQVKQLNVTSVTPAILINSLKPLGSSKVTNLNVYNTSSVSKLSKPLNVSKTVSFNTTAPNTCQASSVSQLIKPSTVSKPVLSNNVHNVRNVGSINQLVKTFNVAKSACSSNTSASVTSNSTCKPVSNLVNDCQSVKPARKLNNVNQKRPHEQLINDKDSLQHDFKKPVTALNILMLSI